MKLFAAHGLYSFFKPRLHLLFILLAFVILLVGQLSGFANDPGVGWHLKTGQWVLNNWAVPHYDPFLYSETLKSWVSHQWLSDLFLFLLFKIGSWPFLAAFFVCLFLWIYFGVLYSGIVEVRKRWQGSLLCVSLAVLFAFKLSLIHFILRPVALGFFVFTFVYLALAKVVCAEPGGTQAKSETVLKIKSGIFISLPVMLALWANLHPSFVFGLMLLAFALASSVFNWLALSWQGRGEALVEQRESLCNAKEAALKKSKLLCLLVTLCFFATLINPYGIKLHKDVLFHPDAAILHHGVVSSEAPIKRSFVHEEWLATDLSSAEGQNFLFVLGLIALSFFLQKNKRAAIREWSLFEFLALLTFTVSSFSAVRMLPYFGIVAALPLARAIEELAGPLFEKRVGPLKQLGLFLSRLEAREKQSSGCFTLLSLLSLCLLFSTWFYAAVPFLGSDLGPAKEHFPYGAIEEIQKRDAAVLREGHQVVVAAPSTWGGFITFMGEGNIKPIVDDRNNVVGENFYQKFHAMLKEGAALEDFRSMGADYLLIPSKSKFASLLEEKAKEKIKYQDDVGLLVDLKGN